MTQFHEGQEVEVKYPTIWRRATIISYQPYVHVAHEPDRYLVKYQDGTRAVFDAEHIRGIPNPNSALWIKQAPNDPFID